MDHAPWGRVPRTNLRYNGQSVQTVRQLRTNIKRGETTLYNGETRTHRVSGQVKRRIGVDEVKVKELADAIDGYDPEMEVAVRVSPATDDGDYSESLDQFFGEYCEVTDERSVLVEYGKLVIVADYEEMDEG